MKLCEIAVQQLSVLLSLISGLPVCITLIIELLNLLL